MQVTEEGVSSNSCAFFNTPSIIAKSMFFYLICIGNFYCHEGYHVERNDYNSYLLMYIKNGEGTVYFDGRTFNAKSNDVVLLNCHKPHMYKTDKWETLWIHFDGNVSSEYFDLLYQRFGCVISLGESTLIPNYLERILKDFKNGSIINEPLVSCYIQRMLTEMFMLSSDYKEYNNPVTVATEYIKCNFRTKLSLQDIADYVSLSGFYFSRVFKKETGYSPYEYVVMVRLNHAKYLLKHTKLTIGEIAFESGFNSESNFVSSFKQHAGMTPTEFRKMPF